VYGTSWLLRVVDHPTTPSLPDRAAWRIGRRSDLPVAPIALASDAMTPSDVFNRSFMIGDTPARKLLIEGLPFIADTDDYAQPWDQPLTYLRAIFTGSLIISIPLAGACFRMTRVSLREVRDAPHLQTARSKGVSEGRVLRRHALPTAAPAVVTLVGVSVPWLVFNAILVEVPYNLPGAFRMAHFGFHLDELHSHLPSPEALQAVVLEAAAIIAAGMLICDVLAAWLDPRLRE
jgi:ABC-type dipeptide/oligopeptide/nickel transport system permease component